MSATNPPVLDRYDVVTGLRNRIRDRARGVVAWASHHPVHGWVCRVEGAPEAIAEVKASHHPESAWGITDESESRVFLFWRGFSAGNGDR